MTPTAQPQPSRTRPMVATPRRLPIGAEVTSIGTHFRVWSPNRRQVRVVCHKGGRQSVPLGAILEREPDGYFSGEVPVATAGMLYGFALDGDDELLPDPASRFQPDGPRGLSQIVDPAAFAWPERQWPGVERAGQVLYEIHLGTFTPEGTWTAARAHLAELADLGVTVLEIMPVAEFAGRFGWSYDGASLFAPSHLYGAPDELRRFVDEAHRVGIGLILDVVYNHWSQEAQRLLRPFAPEYFSSEYKNDWGAAVNFDGEQSSPVREFMLANVRLWIEEYQFDGLRVDAAQAFEDRSRTHILSEICQTARAAAGQRRVLLAGENEQQGAEMLQANEDGGHGFDAVWNDDFHHAAMVRLTGRREAYYTDYYGAAEEFVAGAKWGYLFQGQRYQWQQKGRGAPALDREAEQFVNFLQNHDQLANSLVGLRIHQLTSPGRWRAMSAFWLLSPQTPMFLQGQEFSASSPFLYFNDCPPEEAERVRCGRADFLKQFPSLASDEVQRQLIDPLDERTFRRCQLDWSEREKNAAAMALHRDLLTLRRTDPVLRIHDARNLHGGTLNSDAFFLRFLSATDDTRLLVCNFGAEWRQGSVAHPLVAPPQGTQWQVLWSSDDSRYGGGGIVSPITAEGWRVPGESAILLHSISEDGSP